MKILSYDIESCTGNPNDGSLCSFGYVVANDNLEVIEQEDILVNPIPKKFRLGKLNEPPRITLAYSEETFRNSPKFDKHYEKIKSLFKRTDIAIGFAINNDVKYVNNACESYNLEKIEYKFLDVQTLLTYFDNTNKNLGLKDLGNKYGIEFLPHKSVEDARVTLELLKVICKEMKMSVEELIIYYEIVLGENTKQGYSGQYCKAQIYERKGLKRSKATSGILLHEYKELLKSKPKIRGGILKGKRICFNRNLENADINYSRALMTKIYELSGAYISDLTTCNVYVYNEDIAITDKTLTKVKELIKSGQKIELIAENEFISKLGEIATFEFDDVALLKKHEIEKAKNKQQNNKNKTQNYFGKIKDNEVIVQKNG